MQLPLILLLLNAAATGFMVGLIWFVQIVHYPLFADVGSDAIRQYHPRHARLTTFVVIGPMVIELVTSASLIWQRPPTMPILVAWSGFGLVVLLWLSTALVQVPCHDRFGKMFDSAVIRRLVGGNWLRTLGWSIRGLLVIWVLWRSINFRT